MTYYSSVPAAAATHPDIVGCVVRSAAEGVPVAAIARAMRLPYDCVLNCLKRARRLGALAEIPRPDWPCTPANQNERSPATSAAQTTEKSRSYGAGTKSPSSCRPPEEVEFLCRHIFHLTNLESGFLVVLLRCLFAEKEKLHAVIELQRAHRPLRPLQENPTDPKMVDVMICKLRKKMAAISDGMPGGIPPGGVPFIIRTSWGKGYFLDQSVKDGIYRMLDVGVADLAPDQDPPHGRAQERPRDAVRHHRPVGPVA